MLIRHLPATSIARSAMLLVAACLLFALTVFAPAKGIAAGTADLRSRIGTPSAKAPAASAAQTVSASHGQVR